MPTLPSRNGKAVAGDEKRAKNGKPGDGAPSTRSVFAVILPSLYHSKSLRIKTGVVAAFTFIFLIYLGSFDTTIPPTGIADTPLKSPPSSESLSSLSPPSSPSTPTSPSSPVTPTSPSSPEPVSTSEAPVVEAEMAGADLRDAASLSGKVTEMNSGDGLKYMLYVPGNWSAESAYPMIVFLHGRGESGGFEINSKQSLPLQLKTNATFREQFPFIVFMPQCPQSCASQNEWQADVMQKTTREVNRVAKALNGDFRRIALAGQSMGGNGVLEYASSQQGMFSALVVVCGYLRRHRYSERELLGRIKQTPVWVFHGENDMVIPIEASEDIVEILQEESGGSNVRFTKYPKAPPPPMPEFAHLEGHGSYELVFQDASLYSWLLQQRCETCEIAAQHFVDWIHDDSPKSSSI